MAFLCRCDPDFKGEACSMPACPDNCKDKSGVERGKCSTGGAGQRRCICNPGWTGKKGEKTGFVP